MRVRTQLCSHPNLEKMYVSVLLNRDRRTWMERAGVYEKYGVNGWGNNGKIEEYSGSKSHSTNMKRDSSKYINYYKTNSTIIALVIEAYRSDYIYFDLRIPNWICNSQISKTQHLKRAIRSLPRTSRPICDEMQWLWNRNG